MPLHLFDLPSDLFTLMAEAMMWSTRSVFAQVSKECEGLITRVNENVKLGGFPSVTDPLDHNLWRDLNVPPHLQLRNIGTLRKTPTLTLEHGFTLSGDDVIENLTRPGVLGSMRALGELLEKSKRFHMRTREARRKRILDFKAYLSKTPVPVGSPPHAYIRHMREMPPAYHGTFMQSVASRTIKPRRSFKDFIKGFLEDARIQPPTWVPGANFVYN